MPSFSSTRTVLVTSAFVSLAVLPFTVGTETARGIHEAWVAYLTFCLLAGGASVLVFKGPRFVAASVTGILMVVAFLYFFLTPLVAGSAGFLFIASFLAPPRSQLGSGAREAGAPPR